MCFLKSRMKNVPTLPPFLTSVILTNCHQAPTAWIGGSSASPSTDPVPGPDLEMQAYGLPRLPE